MGNPEERSRRNITRPGMPAAASPRRSDADAPTRPIFQSRTTPVTDARQRIGKIELGAFKVLSLLGRGSFGNAYLAQQLNTERRAVLKVAHHFPEDAAAAEVRRRFDAEVRAATSVHHPNLVTIFTSGETQDGLPAIAMEFVDGETLSDLLYREAPLKGHYLALFQQLASALVTLHQHNILHRDVAPRNVMVTQDHYGEMRAVLLDFGMASLAGPNQSVGPVGTPQFVAPEQLRMRPEPASDVFGLGALLWWALCGTPMRTGHAGNAIGNPRSFNALLNDELADLLLSMVHTRASQRPTAAEFLEIWPHFAAMFDTCMTVKPTAVAGQRRPRALVIEPNVVLGRMLSKAVTRAGLHVDLLQRFELSYGMQPYDVVVLAERGGTNAVRSAVRFVRDTMPNAQLVLSSQGDGSVLANLFDTEVAVPGELQLLEQLLKTLVAGRQATSMQPTSPLLQDQSLPAPRPASLRSAPPAVRSRPPQVAATVVEAFFGVMPELLSDLSIAAAANDIHKMASICADIGRRCDSVSALRMQRITTMYRELLGADAVSDLHALVEEIEQAYHVAYRELAAMARA